MNPTKQNDAEKRHRECDRKIPFTKIQFANKEAKRLRSKYNESTIRAYHCEYCNKYHVGKASIIDKIQ